MSENKYCIILTTFSDDKVGKKIIDSLIEKRLAACVQVQNIQSYFHWKGNVNCDSEKLVLIKTKKSLYKKVETDIIANHSYETPEIIEIPITDGFSGYFQWIDEVCE